MLESRCPGGALTQALRYIGPVRATRGARPSGPYYDVTDEIVDGIEALVAAGKSQREIAAEVDEFAHRMGWVPDGYEVDESTISNIKTRRHTRSRLAYALARLYGWPIPPVSDAPNPRVSHIAAKLEQLDLLDPDELDEIDLIVDGELAKQKLKRK